MIDEKKLIEEIKKFPVMNGEYDHDIADPSYVDGMETACMAIIETIKEIPKVGEWIPCSERLPETDDVVLITVFNIDNNKLFVTPAVYQHPFFCTWNTLAPEDKVIAWQPLPEPWEGEE